MHGERPDTVLSKLCGVSLDSASFQEELLGVLARRGSSKRCLLVYEIEPLVSAAGRILNGFRERLGALRVVIVTIRENRRRDFLTVCPDLMDWIGTNVARAEDLAPPLTLREIDAAIRRFETKFQMSTEQFRAKWAEGQVEPSDDAWLWNELVALREDVSRAEKP